MTRKHYIELARIFNQYQVIFKTNRNVYDQNFYFDEMLKEVTSFLKTDNRHFDKQKFLDAVNKSN